MTSHVSGRSMVPDHAATPSTGSRGGSDSSLGMSLLSTAAIALLAETMTSKKMKTQLIRRGDFTRMRLELGAPALERARVARRNDRIWRGHAAGARDQRASGAVGTVD